MFIHDDYEKTQARCLGVDILMQNTVIPIFKSRKLDSRPSQDYKFTLDQVWLNDSGGFESIYEIHDFEFKKSDINRLMNEFNISIFRNRTFQCGGVKADFRFCDGSYRAQNIF